MHAQLVQAELYQLILLMVIMIKQSEVAKTYKEIFEDDFYLEIQDHGMDVDKPILEGMPKLC
ncbi:MAG: hypothetical protein MZV64_38740 [Ignavibacteriales bacterium]|nr:hypothetical protein [Ignavibacteriales bacterium]